MPSPRRTATSVATATASAQRRGRGSPADRDDGGDVEAVHDELEAAGGQVVAQPHAAGVRRDHLLGVGAGEVVGDGVEQQAYGAGRVVAERLARLDAAAGDAGIGQPTAARPAT